VQNCATLQPTVDGSLAEWAAVTPITLNADTGTVTSPFITVTPGGPTATPTATRGAGTPTFTPAPTATRIFAPTPAVDEFTADFYCAYNGAGDLYLAGAITDTAIVTPTGWLLDGDLAEITLDMLSDGFRQPGVDDHSITIAPDGRVYDFVVRPLDAETATTVGAAAWAFELRIPATAHGLPGLGSGDMAGVTWTYYDRVSAGASWRAKLTTAKRQMVMQ